VQVLAQRGAQINEFFQRRVQLGDLPVMPKIRWHMIGHLQRNKIKQVLPVVSVVHSVDSLRLAEELEVQLAKAGKRLPVMLQVNASEEKSKFGVAVGAAVHLAEQIDTMPQLQLVGLMTMAPLTDKPEEARAVFARTREIFEEMKWHKMGGAGLKHLSMGMSGDFEEAIQEGATMVRVGTDLFGGPSGEQAEEEEA
jgi:pyridoxal phosphate enzyme (YggS family)